MDRASCLPKDSLAFLAEFTAFAHLPAAAATKKGFAEDAILRWKSSGPLLGFLCKSVGLKF